METALIRDQNEIYNLDRLITMPIDDRHVSWRSADDIEVYDTRET